ncbi:hypothetical protein CQ025_02660 [Pseudomonas sp. MYb3]|nr:hypothetical protein CQ025_02660 [Pseudomonas sp. MYb3]
MLTPLEKPVDDALQPTAIFFQIMQNPCRSYRRQRSFDLAFYLVNQDQKIAACDSSYSDLSELPAVFYSHFNGHSNRPIYQDGIS